MRLTRVETFANAIRIIGEKPLSVALACALVVLIAHGAGAADVPFATHVIITDYISGFTDLFAADVDGDGDLDVLTAGRYDNEIALWKNTYGDGSAWAKAEITTSFDGATAVHAGDVDGDGDLDVLGAAYFAGDIVWWENGGGDPIEWTEWSIDSNFTSVRNIRSADVDGDGDLDVLGAAGYPLHQIAWWENLGGDPAGWTKHLITGFTDAFLAHPADLNGDGDADVLGASLSQYGIPWWENQSGDGLVWTRRSVDSDFKWPTRPIAVDVDGDGDLDVVGAANDWHDTTWWENATGDGLSWTEHMIVSSFEGFGWVHAADVDNDGDNDLVGTALTGTDYPAWFENTAGTGLEWIERPVNSSDPWYSTAVLTADVDGDGDHDVLAGSDYGVVWWENLAYDQPEFNERLEMVGDPVLVANPDGLGMGWQSVDVDDLGRFVAAFSLVDNSEDYHVYARVFDGSDQPLTSVHQVSDPSMNCQDGRYGTAVLAGAQGDYLSFWETRYCGLLGRAFTEPGVPDPYGLFTVTDTAAYSVPDIAGLSGDRVLVSRYGQFWILEGPQPPVDPPIQTVGFVGERVAAGSSPGFLIVGDCYPDVCQQRYDDTGNPIGSLRTVGVGFYPDVAALPGERSVVCWHSEDDIPCQLIDSDGSLLGSSFLANTFVDGYHWDGNVTSNENGDFIVVWTDASQYDGKSAIFAQVFDQYGNRIGTEREFRVTPPSSVDYSAWGHIVSMNDNGEVVVVWSTEDPDPALYAQRFRILPPPVTPVADFSWDPLGPVVHDQIRFTDESRYGPPTSWNWDFGDGSTSDEQNPAHTFAAEGNYQVTLVAANENGADQITKTIRVGARLIPLADFSWTPATPTVGDLVTFIDESTFAPTSWEWDFDDDGQPDSFDQRPPDQVFGAPGFKTVTLTATNNYGSHSIAKDIRVLPDPEAPAEPYVSRVTRTYPGFFLDGMTEGTVLNSITAEIEWQGNPSGFVRFVTASETWCEEAGPDGLFSHSFDMASDFEASWTGSTVTITPCNDSSCNQDAGPPRVETVYVFPWPDWLVLADNLDDGAVTIAAGDGEVTAFFSVDFPYPHLAQWCTPDDSYIRCNEVPDVTPLFGKDAIDPGPDQGDLDLVETYARFTGSVSSRGTGRLSLFGQTGFRGMSGMLSGSILGSGEFRLLPPDGLTIIQTSFQLHLAGTVIREQTVSDLPSVKPIFAIPIIGPYIKTIAERASLVGQLAPYLDVSASWAQNEYGNLDFSSAKGTLGLDLKAMLIIDFGRLSLSAWVGGGGSFTLGLPATDLEPLIRAAEVHAELGIQARLDLLFDINVKYALRIGCGYDYVIEPPWFCSFDQAESATALMTEIAEIRVIERDYARFGEYAVFKAEPVARTKSAKVPSAVSETKMVENLFQGASPAIAPSDSGVLLVWEHDDTNDRDLQSTEIAWSFGVGDEWSVPEWIEDDTRAELSPVLGADAAGNIVAAWLRIKDESFSRKIDDVLDLPLFYTQLEVVSAVFDTDARSWYGITQITDDESMDTDLKLASDADGNIMLTWLSNPDGEFQSTADSPSYLMCSIWDGSKFEDPKVVASNLVGVGSHASAIFGNERVVLVPRDPDSTVSGDEVIELYEWNEIVWTGPTLFADGEGWNRAPSVVFDDAGERHVVWLRGDDLVQATLSEPLPVENPPVLRPGSASLAFVGAKLVNSPGGNITLVWQEAVDNQPADIFAMVFDPVKKTWSEDRRLLDSEALVHQTSAAYDSSSELHAAYVETVIGRTTETVTIDGQEFEIPNIPVEEQTSLFVRKQKLIVDLAVDDDDLELQPIPDDPDDRLSATITVHNAGFFSTDIPDVDLYLGDPDTEGKRIGAFTTTDPDPPGSLAAGATLDFTLDFDAPEVPGNLVAVVDRSNMIGEEWEDNNRATWYRENHAPVAVVIADPTRGWCAPLTVEFDGSESYDLDDDDITARWAFADGTDGDKGIDPSHTFDQAGRYPVTLSVTDDHGAVGTATVVIDIPELETPELMVTQAIAVFQAKLADGSIYGLGQQPGMRERIFGEMLDSAAGLIAVGDVAGACSELEQAVARSDGEDRPADFIGGPGVAELNALLVCIMAALGC